MTRPRSRTGSSTYSRAATGSPREACLRSVRRGPRTARGTPRRVPRCGPRLPAAQAGRRPWRTASSTSVVTVSERSAFRSRRRRCRSLPRSRTQSGYPDYLGTLFTITNIGSTSTSPITDGFIGPDAVHFALTSDRCAGIRLAAGASCTVRAFFAPKSSGPHSARLKSTADAGGTVNAMLAGTGPPFTVSPFTHALRVPLRRFNNHRRVHRGELRRRTRRTDHQRSHRKRVQALPATRAKAGSSPREPTAPSRSRSHRLPRATTAGRSSPEPQATKLESRSADLGSGRSRSRLTPPTSGRSEWAPPRRRRST